MSNLIVVESSSKISKIKSILGSGYLILSSCGNFKNLQNNKMSIDFNNNFEPIYVITNKAVVSKLKKSMVGISMVYIASDMDMEGEAIAQHIYDVLKPKKYQRLLFNSVTKSSIQSAMKQNKLIDANKVNGQKARRVVDRLYGFMISSVVRQNTSGISAGRVQSIIVKMVIDKEKEILNFLEKNSENSHFKITGQFDKFDVTLYQTDQTTTDSYRGKILHVVPEENHDNVKNILNNCHQSTFKIRHVESYCKKKDPPPPFETSTLQQFANIKLKMKIDETMKVAQKLYESGLITYMRTDSVSISIEGHENIKAAIKNLFGKKYYEKRNYANGTVNCQEAHEAIRPTDCHVTDISEYNFTSIHTKLYQLIWQRTMASQMKSTTIENANIQIDISKYVNSSPIYYFQTTLTRISDPGYLIVYDKKSQDTLEIPKINKIVNINKIKGVQEYSTPPSRYDSASLVAHMKKMGIGRPATYVPSINLVFDRKYLVVGNVAGVSKNIHSLFLNKDGTITEKQNTIYLGKESDKYLTTEIGVEVVNFLENNFDEMMDYKFTAKLESDIDKIASGDKIWHHVVKKLYDKLLPRINHLSKNTNHSELAPKTITIGTYKKHDITIHQGKYGKYIRYNSINYSIKDGFDLTIDNIIELINTKKSTVLKRYKFTKNSVPIIVSIIDGKYGAYINVNYNDKHQNFRIGKGVDPTKITKSQVNDIIFQK